MVKKIAWVLVLLPGLFLATAPKKEFYYLFEKQLAKRGVIFSDETVREHPIGLILSHPVLYVKGVRVASIDTVSLWTVFLYTRASIASLTLDASLADMLPGALAHARASYSVLDPTRIQLRIDDPQLQGSGAIDFKTHTMRIVLPKEPPKSLRPFLKQTKEGWIYEKHF